MSDCTSGITFLPWVSGESLSPLNFARHMGSIGTSSSSLTFTAWASSESLTFAHMNTHQSHFSISTVIAWVSGESLSPSNLNRHLQSIVITYTCVETNHLAFGQQPTSDGGEVGAPISPAVTVELRDSEDAVVTAFEGDITMELGKNEVNPPPNDGVLSGTLTQAAVAGVATFDDLSITMHNGGSDGLFTLIASSTGVDDVESDEFSMGWPV